MTSSDIERHHVVGQIVDKKTGDEKVAVTKATIPDLPDGTYRIADCLYLRKRKGRSSFFFRVMVSGDRHDISIGPFPAVTLTLAKSKAAAMRAEIAAGGKPWARKVNQGVKLKDFWGPALDTYAATRHWKRHDRTLTTMKYRVEKYVLPKIGHKPVMDIEREDVLEIISGMWSEQPILANNIRFILEKVIGMAMTQGIVKSNPAVIKGNLEFFLPPVTKIRKVKHHACADFERTKEILRYFNVGQYAAWHCIVFIILTGRRVAEAIYSKWEHFDLDEGVWIVPNENMKKDRGADRRVPLSRQLCEIMRGWEHHGDYVFSANGKRPIPKSNAIQALNKKFPEPTMHGFRSTFTSWCADHGVDVEVVEACLDHSSGSLVRQAYQRSDLFDRRREVLQQYADALFME